VGCVVYFIAYEMKVKSYYSMYAALTVNSGRSLIIQ